MTLLTIKDSLLVTRLNPVRKRLQGALNRRPNKNNISLSIYSLIPGKKQYAASMNSYSTIAKKTHTLVLEMQCRKAHASHAKRELLSAAEGFVSWDMSKGWRL